MKKTWAIGLCLAILLVFAFVASGCGSGSSHDSGTAGAVTDLTYNVQACRANQRNLQSACAMYFAEKGQWPRTLHDLVPGYMQAKDLQCPSGGSYTMRVSGGQVAVTCPHGHNL